MTRRNGTLHRLANDQRGVSAVEFGILALPLFVMIMGALDLGYQIYVRTMMQGALDEAARIAMVEDPQFATSGSGNSKGKGKNTSVEDQIEAAIRETTGTVARDATISVSERSYYDFSDFAKPERLITDNNGNGEYDEDDGDCWEDSNGNGAYDTDAGADGVGRASDMVFYTANISMPRLLPLDTFIGLPSTIEMTVDTVVRNEPYSGREQPAVLCEPE